MTTLLKAILWLCPLTLFFIPLPLVEEYATRENSLEIVVIAYGLLICCSMAYHFAVGRAERGVFAHGIQLISFGVLLLVGYSLANKGFLPSFVISAGVLFLLAITASAYLAVHQRIRYGGLVGFALTIALIGSVEMTLQRAPDHILLKTVRSTPPLVLPDEMNKIYRKNYFRGKIPCTDCPDNTVRIVTMGGSSTYGVPMHYSSRAYASVLQRTLNERRPRENFEVLNGGAAAMGIMQVIAALDEEVLKYQPDIVTVCAWFNDSASSPRWYRIPGVSDREGYEIRNRLLRLQEFPVYKQIRESRMYATSRFYLLQARGGMTGRKGMKKASGRPRMTPEEYRWGLEQVVALGKEHDFLPVFVIEALYRGGTLDEMKQHNKYIATLLEIAAEHSIPVADPATLMDEQGGVTLYYDFIHPNVAGHELVAESIYNTLFVNEPTELSNAFWKSRNIEQKAPNTQRAPLFQFETDKLRNRELLVTARLPYVNDRPAKLQVSLNQKHVAALDGVSERFKEFRVPLGTLSGQPPISEIILQAKLGDSKGARAYPIGETGAVSPAVIKAVSGGKDYGWTSLIEVNGKRHDYNHRGYSVVVIGAKSGEIKKTALFDIYKSAKENTRFSEFVESLSSYNEDGKPPIVVVAVKTDGGILAKKSILSPMFRSLGGTGAIPQHYHSFLLIGSPGAKPGTAIEQVGPKKLSVVVGDEQPRGIDLLEVAKLEVR